MSEKREFSTTELARHPSDVLTAALRAPVILTQHNKRRLVLLSIEEYTRLTTPPAETRSVGRLRDMPTELADDFVAAARAYLDGDEE